MEETELAKYKRLAQGMYEQTQQLKRENEELRKLSEIKNVASTIRLPHRVFGEQKAKDSEIAELRAYLKDAQDYLQKTSRSGDQRKFYDLKKQLSEDLSAEKLRNQQLQVQYTDVATKYNDLVKRYNTAREALDEVETRQAEAVALANRLTQEENKNFALRSQNAQLVASLASAQEELTGSTAECDALKRENAKLAAQNEQLQNINRVMLLLYQENVYLKQQLIKCQAELQTKTLKLQASEQAAYPQYQPSAQSTSQQSEISDTAVAQALEDNSALARVSNAVERLQQIRDELGALKDFAQLLRNNLYGGVPDGIQAALTASIKLGIAACSMFELLQGRYEQFEANPGSDNGDNGASPENPETCQEPLPTEPTENAPESSFLHGAQMRRTSRISRIAHVQRDSPQMLSPVAADEISQEASQSSWLQHIRAYIQLFEQFAAQYQLRSAGALRVLKRRADETDTYDLNQIIAVANAVTDEQLIVFEAVDELLAQKKAE